MTRRTTLLSLAAAAASCLASCAAPEPVRALSSAQQAAIEELALAWSAEHALARAELTLLIDIRCTAIRGRIHRELIASGCLTPDGDVDTSALANAIADPAADFALIREIRLGRMTEARAVTWLTDYAAALRVSDAAGGPTLRAAMFNRFAELESINRAWTDLQRDLDERAQRIASLAIEASAASGALADAFEARIAWRAIGAEAGAGALTPAIDALFTDPARRAAARDLIDRLLTSTTP